MVENQYYTSQIRGNIVVTNNLWALILFVNEKGEKVFEYRRFFWR